MNININLSEEEVRFLEQYAAVYDEERKLDCTSQPIVVVEKRKSIVSHEDYGCDAFYYAIVDDCDVIFSTEDENGREQLAVKIRSNSDLPAMSDDELEDLLDDISEQKEWKFGTIKVQILPVSHIWEPVAYFLTRAEAEKYRKYQAHNLGISRAYSRYVGYSNIGDLPSLISLLKRIGEGINGNNPEIEITGMTDAELENALSKNSQVKKR